MADARYKATRQRITHAYLANTDGVETELVPAGGVGIKRDLAFLILANSSAAAVSVDIRDALAGTIRMTVRVNAESTVPVPIPVPLPQAVANTAWTIDASGATTTLYATAITLDAE